MTFKRRLQGEAHRRNKFRLTLPLAEVPALDDAQRMPELRNKARAQAQANGEVQAIVQAMLCTQFFLELDTHPEYSAGIWEVRASIRCRSPDARAVVRRLREEYPAAMFVKDRDSLLGPVEELDICETCGLYRRKVGFTVRDLDEDVRIALQLDDARRWSISAFQPSRKMRWFVERQGLDAPFGCADHADNGTGDGRACGCEAKKTNTCMSRATTQSTKPARSIGRRMGRAPIPTAPGGVESGGVKQAPCSKAGDTHHIRGGSRKRKRVGRDDPEAPKKVRRRW